MEQKKKNWLLTALIYFVILAAYNLIVFMVFKGFNAVFWISYICMMAAFVLHILCVYFIVQNVSIRTVFFGIPLMSLSIYFVCAELFCSFVFMIFKASVSVKLAILIQALLLCVFIITAVLSIMARDAVQNVDTKIKDNVNFIKGIHVDVEMLIQRSQDADTTRALKKLSETVKYSDPMSNPAVYAQERMIMQYMMELGNAFNSGNMEETREVCEKIELLFIERNKELMISK
ncbi:hypothetical protein [Faecalicatena orotica]|uniref:hypothetical protein n=1 Tax=Faecalicatena orotica TaxID=1544 RepID=UPI00321767D7